MGKWTLEYHDEVLRNKMKNLVQGAIKRMKTEKDGPTMSYEAFVEDLDEGDSFTTSLVDVLVKELAERRTRPNPTDRRLISERTAKSLRSQAEPPHIYRTGGSLRERVRRSASIPRPQPYSSSRVILSDSDGEEEYGTILDSLGRLEGAQINSDLYDAYGGPSSSIFDSPGALPRTVNRAVDSPRPSDHDGPPWQMNSPPPRSPVGFGSWTGLGGAGLSLLNRQSTIRRPHRSRTIDPSEFTTFTSRRRSTIRNSVNQEDDPRAESHTETPGTFIPTESARLTPGSSDAVPSRSTRLSNYISRRMSDSPFPASDELSSGRAIPNPTSSQMWHSMAAASSSSSDSIIPISVLTRRSSTTDLNDDRRQVIAPRLRRGGLRPPESLLLQGPATPSDASLAGTDELTHMLPGELTASDIDRLDGTTMESVQSHPVRSLLRPLSPVVDSQQVESYVP